MASNHGRGAGGEDPGDGSAAAKDGLGHHRTVGSGEWAGAVLPPATPRSADVVAGRRGDVARGKRRLIGARRAGQEAPPIYGQDAQ